MEAEFNRASNAAKLLQLSQAALDALSENENSLLTQAGAIGRTLQELQRVDAGAANLVELHAQAAGSLRELQSELSRYAEKVDVDPARLAELEERLNLIHSLKRKYGATLAEVIAFGDEAKQKLAQLELPRRRTRAPQRRAGKTGCGNVKRRQKTFRRAQKSDSATGESRRPNSLRIWASGKASLTWRFRLIP